MPRGLVMSPTVTLAFPCRHGWHSERPVRGRTGLAKAQADPSKPNYERWREQPEHTSCTVNKGWSTGAAVGARVMLKSSKGFLHCFENWTTATLNRSQYINAKSIWTTE